MKFLKQQNISGKIFALHVLGFLFNINIALPSYISSSFISSFTGEGAVGIVYAIASAVTIAVFFMMPKLIKKIGEYRALFWLIVLELLTLLGIIFLRLPLFIVLCFIGSLVLATLISFLMDVLLENYSRDSATGNIRGAYLTTANIAWVIVPSLGGLLLGTTNNYIRVFIAAAIFIIPMLIIAQSSLKNSPEPNIPHPRHGEALKNVLKNKNLTSIFIISFLLQFFYSWMLIYTPIYLHIYLGFNWETIGFAFTIMLLPFILIEWPIGRLADTRFGEKEMLTVGFIIIAISTATISFFNSAHIVTWAVILFATRIGASMIEIMSETYFFKNVGPQDVSTISLFRTMHPWAYIAGPVVATVFLAFFPFKYLFLGLGLILFLGLRESLVLKDTK